MVIVICRCLHFCFTLAQGLLYFALLPHPLLGTREMVSLSFSTVKTVPRLTRAMLPWLPLANRLVSFMAPTHQWSIDKLKWIEIYEILFQNHRLGSPTFHELDLKLCYILKKSWADIFRVGSHRGDENVCQFFSFSFHFSFISFHFPALHSKL